MKIQKIQRTCDYCGYEGEPGGEYVTTHTISFDRETREVDACAECVISQMSWLVQIGRKVTAAVSVRKGRSMADRRRTADIRRWALDNGHTIHPHHGRIPAEIVEAYNAR